MKTNDTTKIKTIALAGHSNAGKTALVEALLFKAGVTDRLGKSSEGNTVSDYDPEEIKRKVSINTSLMNFDNKGTKVNLIDTPGLFDFAAGMQEGISACDTVMIVASGKSEMRVGARKAFEAAEKYNKSKMVVITKLDDLHADFYKTFTSIRNYYGHNVCPVVIPVRKDEALDGLINLLDGKYYEFDQKGNAKECSVPVGKLTPKTEWTADDMRLVLSEAVAEVNEELMEKFFEGEEFTTEELIAGLKAGMHDGTLTPVFAVSSLSTAGIEILLSSINSIFPSPNEAAPSSTVDGEQISCDDKAPLSAFVFRTIADPYVGKMSFIKVNSGVLSADKEIVNATTGETEKIGKLYYMLGKKQEETASAVAGDIVVATKINANTSDTLCSSDKVIQYRPITYPAPCYSMAVRAKAQGDEAKISSALTKILEEDKTLKFETDKTTKEQVLSGLGDQHLEVIISKIKSKFGAEVELTVPKIAYKETIRKKVEVEGKHKKQSGGHGQFGHVKIEFEPCDSEELVFAERVFGGSVPKNFFPAVEKGLQDCVKHGVLAGCPVVGLKATLFDGSYHPVDSSEMAFKMAASIAFKEGLKNADPIMLEPIGSLDVSVPDDKNGDVMGELNKRRGRVLGMEPASKGMTMIQAEVPMREMHDFAMYLRQTTKGMGSFLFRFERYEALPSNLLDEVVAQAKTAEAE